MNFRNCRITLPKRTAEMKSYKPNYDMHAIIKSGWFQMTKPIVFTTDDCSIIMHQSSRDRVDTNLMGCSRGATSPYTEHQGCNGSLLAPGGPSAPHVIHLPWILPQHDTNVVNGQAPLIVYCVLLWCTASCRNCVCNRQVLLIWLLLRQLYSVWFAEASINHY